MYQILYNTPKVVKLNVGAKTTKSKKLALANKNACMVC
jgi:hypothetical protein